MTSRALALVAAALVLAARAGGTGSPPCAGTESDPRRAQAMAAAPSDHAASALVAARQARVRLLPRESDEWVALGHAWMALDHEAQHEGLALNARACAGIAAELSPDATAPRGLEASVLLDEHRFGEALVMADDVLRRVPDDAAALAVACDAALELGRVDEAVELTQRLADAHPGLAAGVRIAWLRWITGDVEGSLEAFASARSAGSPRDPEPLAWCLAQEAQVRFSSGDAAGAAAAAAEALRIRPRQALALTVTARVALASGDPRSALRSLELADAASPTAEVAWLTGDAREAAGDAVGARGAWDLAERRARRSDRRALGALLATKNRDIPDAVAALRAESSGRGEPVTMDALAWALYRAGRLDEARVASDAARRWGTRDPLLLFHAGAIRMATGERSEGEALVREALAIQPAFDVTGATEARALLEYAPPAR